MDNILYIGPYREFSGLGNASRMYIRSLIRTGHNISIRPIYNVHREYPESEIEDEILELELNFSKKYHKVIQHSYPHQFCYNSNFDEHIGIVHLESSNYFINIIQYLSNMDKIIVGSNFVKNQVQRYIPKIFVVPEPIDLELINNHKNNNTNKKENDSYSFYCISEWSFRKNIDKIIFAFLKLANYYENIELVIKTKSSIYSDTDIKEGIEYTLSKLNKVVNTNKIKKPKIVVGETSLDGIYYIHNNNDCLINVSSGESFGYPVLESMAFNNNIIGNDKGSISEIISDGCGLLTKTEPVQCFDEDRPYPIYNSSLQLFDSPFMNDLYSNMQIAINENQTEKENRIKKQSEKIQSYSIENISKLLNNVLL